MSLSITEMQKSALQEAGNIGAGHAAIALSQLMGKKIMIAIPKIEITQYAKLNTVIDNKNKEFIQISLMVLGDTLGAIVFLIERQTAHTLCDIVIKKPKQSTKHLGEMEESALKEVGSIISASYLNAISKMTGMSLVVSAPDISFGKTSALNKTIAKHDIALSEVKDILCIKTEFIETTTKLEGFLVLVPAEQAIKKIIKALGA